MLQINTGKFFREGQELYVSRHRGIVFTNYICHHELQTVVGTLVPAVPYNELSVMVYEFDERLEAHDLDGRRSPLASTGGTYAVEDFSAVAAFALNITCTQDADLARRLTESSRGGRAIRRAPQSYVRRVFDP